MLLVVDGCITNEDEDSFNVSYDGLSNAHSQVDFCMKNIVDVYRMGCVSTTSIRIQ